MTVTSPQADPTGGDSDRLWLDMIATGLAPERRPHHWPTPGHMAQALDRTTRQTPALELIDQRLVDIAEGRCERLIVSMPPQEGKSERTSRRFPLWMLHRNPNLRIAIVSSGLTLARRFGGLIRDDLRANPQLGLSLSESTHAKHEFELLGYGGGVYCVGIDGMLTGRPVDLLIIDDPYKDAGQADSKAWQTTVRNFWTEVALPRLAPGAPVVVIETRWREDDLAGWLQDEGDDWTVVNIPAQADHDPAKGEVDVLGRDPGEFMISARDRSDEDWAKKQREVGSRSWNALYQGRPSPVEGEFFKRSWWRYYDTCPWVERPDGSRIVVGHFDDMLISWDLTFKDTAGSDYVAAGVWLRRGADAFLLDRLRQRLNFPNTVAAFVQMAARWPQATLKIVEDKANGPAVIASLRRRVPGIVPEEPQGGKEARAAAVAPLVEAGNVWLPDPMLAAEGDKRPFAWVADFVEECAGFPTAKHDDEVDQMSQGLNRLILQPLWAGESLDEDDFDSELAGFSISPF